ncbi:hypothetical protein T265_00899 [Opisthorchis viverrini]|uniref:Uncharacterized protein n=1 Tax=Opisthorchis viverrini TaxID=6198 RepID=A0A075A0K2_OPIVI|nr:hypothetical protein T265_00899 [Opisthorchis viverrini]KER33208.1 hypothetical protein T265_00899 [Opisthorchis viverrini]
MIGCWVQTFDQSDLGLMPDRQASRTFDQSCVGWSSRPTTTNPPLRTTTLPNNALMISPRLVMKRLQSNCPAQRTSQRPSTLSELLTFSSIERRKLFWNDL